jgi:hypothetical protein
MTTARFDIYRQIHKAMRACICDALLAAGRIDPMDDTERAQLLAQVRGMLTFARGHLEKEDKFVHPAMEARAPGSSSQTAGDHADHAHAFADLEAALAALEHGEAGQRPAAAHALYGKIAQFLGENLLHMEVEESANNEVLWRTHSDDELLALELAIVASLSPPEKSYAAQWMLPFANPEERAQMLRAMQPGLPPEAFAGLLHMLKSRLIPAHWRKLTIALDAPHLAA